ncbi:hypothetical protein F5Y18DRAFT_435132 [Xylariaceae sp. FL1019]|nr:hypothetical protein F5Y18DRAFT_435132 [Xylariaceae sp. FL1019]
MAKKEEEQLNEYENFYLRGDLVLYERSNARILSDFPLSVENVWDGIEGLVYDFVSDLNTFPDDDQIPEFVEGLNDIKLASGFTDTILKSQDLQRLMAYPESDPDLLASFLSRFIIERVFQKNLFDGATHEYVRLIQALEDRIANTYERELGNHPRTPFFKQTWRYETYRALCELPEVQDMFRNNRRRVANQLRELLGFLQGLSGFEEFIRDFENIVLVRAFTVHQNMIVTFHRHHFGSMPLPSTRAARVDFALSEQTKGGRISQTEEMGRVHTVMNLMNVGWRNILQAYKSVQIPEENIEDLKNDFDPLCVKYPAVYSQQFGFEAGRKPHRFDYGDVVKTAPRRAIAAYGTRGERLAEQRAGKSLFYQVCEASYKARYT